MKKNTKTKKSDWTRYCEYLIQWVVEHQREMFAGMSPACYNEWLDNEGVENE